MLRLIFAFAAALALTACANLTTPTDPDYQLGDLTGSVLQMQAEYCATAEPGQRALRLAALRAAGVPIPPSGACTDILALVPEAEMDVDVEQAERDRERYEGVTDADTDPVPAADVQGAE